MGPRVVWFPNKADYLTINEVRLVKTVCLKSFAAAHI